MFNIEQLRKRQEQRLAPALESWNQAKEHLQKAIEFAELREKEFREVSDDVQRKLQALDLVLEMAGEPGAERSLSPSANRPVLMLAEKALTEKALPEKSNEAEAIAAPEAALTRRSTEPRSRGFAGFVRTSSRPLFPSYRRGNSVLSILP
jgi:hypothetical protein